MQQGDRAIDIAVRKNHLEIVELFNPKVVFSGCLSIVIPVMMLFVTFSIITYIISRPMVQNCRSEYILDYQKVGDKMYWFTK